MKNPCQDKIKRNRNIGTSKQGHGQNNTFSIPQPWDTSKYFYERFQGINVDTIIVHGREITVVIEDLSVGYYYSFTPKEAQLVLDNLPKKDLISFGLLIFRQPKKKERILSSVWGRLVYSYEFRGDYLPVIIEATPENKNFTFPKKQSVDRRQEFELLQEDGLDFEMGKREYVAVVDKEKIKSIQLHRTLLHEVGHYVHYLEVVERPGRPDEEYKFWEKRYNAYFSIPSTDKEAFANKYAVVQKKRLQQIGII
jgi:hypothetical protein